MATERKHSPEIEEAIASMIDLFRRTEPHHDAIWAAENALQAIGAEMKTIIDAAGEHGLAIVAVANARYSAERGDRETARYHAGQAVNDGQ